MKITLPYQGKKPIGRIKVVDGILKSFKMQDNYLLLSYVFDDLSITFRIGEELAKEIITETFTAPDGHILLEQRTEEEIRRFQKDVGYGTETHTLPIIVNYVCQAFDVGNGLIPSCVIETLKDVEFIKNLPSDFIEIQSSEEPEVTPEQKPMPAKEQKEQADIDKDKEEIRRLKNQLSATEKELERANDRISSLEEQLEDSISNKNVTEFLEDSDLDEELEKEYAREVGSKAKLVGKKKGSVDGFYEDNIKNVNNILWKLVKECKTKRVSEESLKHLLLNLKWKIISLNYQIDVLNEKLYEAETEVLGLKDDLEAEKKEKEDKEEELKSRRQQLAKLLEEPLEEWEAILKEPKKSGYKLPPSKYEILKFLFINGKSDWKRLHDGLIGAKKFKSLSTLSVSLNALIQGKLVKKNPDKTYEITQAGIDVKNAYEGKV